VYIGARIGELEIRHASGASDRIPLIMGATAWFVQQWAIGTSHSCRPFRGHVNGRCFKDVSIGGHPASGFNPPLIAEENLVVLEMPADAADLQFLRLYTREGSVALPNEAELRGFRL
jgi:hypothetical protein